jgi:hypothetical protein
LISEINEYEMIFLHPILICEFSHSLDPERTLATLWDLLQRNIETADVRSKLDARLGPLQVEPHTFSIP